MPFFTASSSLHGTAFVVQACGELDYQYAPVFRSEMAKAWESGSVLRGHRRHRTHLLWTPPASGSSS